MISEQICVPEYVYLYTGHIRGKNRIKTKDLILVELKIPIK